MCRQYIGVCDDASLTAAAAATRHRCRRHRRPSPDATFNNINLIVFNIVIFAILPTDCQQQLNDDSTETSTSVTWPSVSPSARRLDISPPGNAVGQLRRPVGSSVVFTCTRHDVTRTNSLLQWLDKNDMRIPDTASDLHGARLVYSESVTSSMIKLYIRQTHNKHAGPYTCVDVDVDLQSRVASARIVLLLYRDVEFEDDISVVSAACGANVLMPCVAHGQPEPVISWTFSQRRLDVDGSQHYEQRHDGLFIRNVTTADEGVYSCQALVEANGELKERVMRLQLLAGPTYGEFRVTSQTGIEGQSLIVNCSATGSPNMSYEFFKDGRPLGDDSRVTTDISGGLLMVARVQRSDAGNYLCIASNSVGRMTAERDVIVHSRPVIVEFKDIIESRGMTATLLCRSFALPTPTLSFRRRLSSLQRDVTYSAADAGPVYDIGRIRVRDVIPGCSELIISDVRVDDVGVYECESHNYVGVDRRNASIDVGYLPEFTTVDERVLYAWTTAHHRHHHHHVQLQQLASTSWRWRRNLTCVVDALPAPTITWTHGSQGQLRHNNDTFHRYDVNSSVSVLQVSLPESTSKQLNADWFFGDYYCTASNFFGSAVTSWLLRHADVPGKPRAIRVLRCLTTSIHLQVEPPPRVDGLPVTGYVVQNEMDVLHVDLGDDIWMSGLRPSTVYMVNVAAVNDVGIGRPMQFAFTTADLRGPSVVNQLTVRPVTSYKHTDYVVSWQTPTEDGGLPIRKYLLQYRQVYPTEWLPADNWTSLTLLPDDDDVIRQDGGSSMEYRLMSRLDVDQYYELRVRAVNDLDCSALSSSSPFVIYTDRHRTWSSDDAVAFRSDMLKSSANGVIHASSVSLVFIVVMTTILRLHSDVMNAFPYVIVSLCAVMWQTSADSGDSCRKVTRIR